MEDLTPKFCVTKCSCDKENCENLLFIMFDPIIEQPDTRANQLVTSVSFPINQVDNLIKVLQGFKENKQTKGVYFKNDTRNNLN